LVAGLYCALSPFREYRKWLRRVYVLTDRRMIAFDGQKHATLRRFAVEPLGAVTRFSHRDGCSDLLIAPGVSTQYDAWSQRGPVGFLRIRDADQLEGLLARQPTCSSAIQTIDHPTHDRSARFTERVGLVLIFTAVFPLAFLGWFRLAAGLFFAIVAAVIAVPFRRGKRSICPRCGQRLNRDQDTPRGTYYFTCAKCQVRWASRIITM
jgi:hypothetical protein